LKEALQVARPASLLPANASVKVTQSLSVEANVIQEAGRPLTDKATNNSGLVTSEVEVRTEQVEHETTVKQLHKQNFS
jgi:hypothetical protein